MSGKRKLEAEHITAFAKTPSGIRGLDEITFGGLPKGRPTLIAGGPGSGKTLMSMEFLVRGAIDFNEPGVFMAFEETAEELAQNVASLGFDLEELIAEKKIVVDYVRVERSEIEETGEYDLEGCLFALITQLRALAQSVLFLTQLNLCLQVLVMRLFCVPNFADYFVG